MTFKCSLDNGKNKQDLDGFVDVEADVESEAAQICAEWQCNEGDHLIKILVYNPTTKKITAWLVEVEWHATYRATQRATREAIKVAGAE